MSHEPSHIDPEEAAKSVAAGYEISDVNPQNLLVFAISLFVTLIVVIGVSGLIFEVMKSQEDRAGDEAQKNVLPGGNDIKPLGAPLQPSAADPQMDWQEWNAMKAENQRIASTLGTEQMKDGKPHTHIPVDWAIRLMAKNGIPQNTATNVPVPVGTAVSGPTEYSPAYNTDGRDNPAP